MDDRDIRVAKKRKNPRKSSTSVILPPKHTGLVNLVREFIEREEYAPAGHAKKRLDQRQVTIKEVRAAILGGKRVIKDDEFHIHDSNGILVNRWSYAFTKQGLDRKVKVCVSIDESKNKPLLIVTVINLD